ncbi:MAG: hypothetical protein FE78DRAFT_109802 [Acidomyces sp. 'richmondensis']|nr:MAG: hypothetical protein FE78DRAFT_109802 [Acidomyces sp. 'richmondensis']
MHDKDGKVICAFASCWFVYFILMVFLGPKKRGKCLDVEHDKDMAEAIGCKTNGQHSVSNLEFRCEKQRNV